MLLVALSLWMMTGFSAYVPEWQIVASGVVQGLGLVFVPVSTIARATLPGQARTGGAGVFSLARNIGSSVGISIMFSLVARGVQINHAEISVRVSRYAAVDLPSLWNLDQATGLAALNAEITHQAAAIV